MHKRLDFRHENGAYKSAKDRFEGKANKRSTLKNEGKACRSWRVVYENKTCESTRGRFEKKRKIECQVSKIEVEHAKEKRLDMETKVHKLG